MKILQVHNRRSAAGGEDAVVDNTIQLLQSGGHEAQLWEESVAERGIHLLDKLVLFIEGIYSIKAKRALQRVADDFGPDVIHIHNLYPLLSPSIIHAARKRGIPTVLHCHNHFLTCPIGTHLRDQKYCDECFSGSVSACVRHNCRKSFLESFAYAMRSFVARKRGWFKNDVTKIVVPTHYFKRRLVAAGYSESKVVVIPNSVDGKQAPAQHLSRRYVLYIGRLSAEKGIFDILTAAKAIADLEFLVAGTGPDEEVMKALAPKNVKFVGWVNKDRSAELFQGALLTIVPSICLETFGLVAAEALLHCSPVIAPDHGGLAEIVDHEHTGLLYTPGDTDQMIKHIQRLGQDEPFRAQLGKNGRVVALEKFSDGIYLNSILKLYRSLKNSETSPNE